MTLALIGGGGVAYARSRTSGPGYRTAAVQTGAATHVLVSSGTIGPALAKTVSFPTSGTVASVRVRVGQPVSAGTVLATLDSTAQSAAVTMAKSTLADAQLTLYQAENGQIEQSGGQSPGGASARSAGVTATTAMISVGTGRSGSSPSGGTTTIVAAQRKLLAAQKQVDAMLGRTKAALALADTLCTASPSPTTSASSSTLPTSVPTPSATSDLGSTPPGRIPGSPAPTTCSAALQQVLTDQTMTLAQQEALSGQEAALTALLGRASGSATGSRSGATTGSGVSRPSGTTSSGATVAASAAQLAADQAAVDAAQAELMVAQQNLVQTTIRSPIKGSVVAVGLTVGQRSGTNGVEVVGSSAHVVTTDVPVADIDTIKVGQGVTVTLDGSVTTLVGTVVQVPVAPVSEGTTTSYAVVVGLAGAPTGLRDGAGATVAIRTGFVAGAVVVPTSAVHYVGSLALVTTVVDGATTAVPVRVGVVGPVWTAVTASRAGTLPAGAAVVLADLSEPLPTSNPTTGRTGFGGAARFAGTRG